MKNFYICLIAMMMTCLGFSQSEITITTSGGSFAGEKWVSITTAVDGGGTQIWGQGSGTQCDSSGLLTNELVNLPAGTYYVNCYDQYDDSWDGTLISVEAYGSVIGDNGGVTPDDGLDTDSSSACEGTPDELEASFQIIVPVPPSCLPVTALALDSATDTTANISWTAGDTETDWEIIVQAAGTGVPGAGDGSGTDTTTNAPHVWSGLTAQTAYEVYVRAECTAGTDFSDWSAPLNFTTACATFTAPYTEDFEDAGALPACWSLGGDDVWEFNNSGAGEHIGNNGTLSGSTTSGSYFAWVDDSTPDATNAELRSPFVDLSPLTTPGLSFYLISDNEGNSNATLTVDVWDGAAWNTVATLSGNTSGWEEQIFDISGLTFTGPAQVRFLNADSGEFYDDIAIDDVRFYEYPSCFNPSGLTIDSFNASSATVSWTAGISGETAWEIAFQASGAGAPVGSGIATSSNPHIQLSLSGSTAYDVYLRADCTGGDYSEWIGPASFITDPSSVPDCVASTTATPDLACGNFDTTISWDSVIADGYNLTVGTTPGGTDILDNFDVGAVTTYDVGSQNHNTQYYYTVSPYNGAFGANNTCSEQTYTTFATGCYCPSDPSSHDNSGITNVLLGLTGHASATEVEYYDYTALTPEPFFQNLNSDLEITFETGFSYSVNVWIDFNDDFNFDPSEKVHSGLSTNANPTTYIADFTMPGSAPLGDHRMRIVTADNDTLDDACYNGPFGVTVDFTINVDVVACTPATVDSVTIVDNCAAGTYTVEVEVSDIGSGGPGTTLFVWGANFPDLIVGTNIAGPYAIGTDSDDISILDALNNACSISIGVQNSTAVPPSGLGASNITATTVDLGWTVNGPETNWEVLILAGGSATPAGTTPGVGTLGANPVTYPGLTSQTDYDAYVRADCGTDLDWVGPVSFTTLCNTIVPNYTANMALNVDACWDQATNGEVASGPTGFGSSAWRSGETYGGTASNAVNIFGSFTAIRDWLLSPTFDLSAGGYQLEVNVAVTDWQTDATPDTMGADDEVQLLVSEDGGTTWTNITTWNVGNQPAVGGTDFILDLTPYTGDTQFAIWASNGTASGQDYDFHIGKFVVRTPPTCGDVTGITVSNVTDNSAQLDWTDAEGESAWEVAVLASPSVTPDTAPGTGTLVLSNSIPWISLASATTYDVYVRADCDGAGNLGSWVGPVSFTTLPDAPTGVTCVSGSSSIIFTEEFDTVGGWTGNINTGNDSWEIPDGATSADTGADTAHSGANYMNWEASGNNTNTGVAVSPAIDLVPAIDGAELAFYMHAYGEDMGTLNVGVSTTGPGGPFTTEFTWSGELQTDGADAWVPVGVDLSAYMGSTVHIQFSQTGSGGSNFAGDMSIDLMTVEACGPYCVDPTAIAGTNITGSTIDLSWTENGSATNWEVAVQTAGTGEPGAADGSGTDITNNPYTRTGLTASTAYEVYVRAECTAGTDFSGWAGPYNFSTTVDCPNVTGITLDSFTNTTAEISWTAGGGLNEAGWEIVVQPDATGPPVGAGTPATSPYSAIGLTQQTDYEVYIRSMCAGDGESGWEGPFDFTTACDVFTIPFTETFDSTSTTESCWTVLNENADGDSWDLDYTLDTITGDESAAINTDFNAGNNDDWLITPTLTLTGNERLVFRYSLQSPGEPNDFEVLLSTSGTAPASFTNTLLALASYNDVDVDNGESTELTIDLSAYSGDVNIAWHIPSGGLDGWRLYIDDVVVEPLPACSDVTGIAVSNINTTTADITWTAGDVGDTLWEIAVQTAGTGEPGAADGSGTDTGSNNPYNATSLVENTAYEVYVRTDCSGDFGAWIGPVNFSTICSAFAVPFTETFDSTSTSESCWTVLNENADGDAWDLDYTLDTITGDESAAINTDFNGGNNDDWLITPTITLTGNERLIFRYSLQSPGEPNDFEVLLSTSGTAPASFTNTLLALASYNDVDVDNGESTELTIDLSAYSGDVNIAWHIPSGGLDGWRLYIDDVVVEPVTFLYGCIRN